MQKPVTKDHCTEIGYVKKTHGVKGELQLFYHEGIDEILDELEYIFFEYEGLLVPFFIDEIFSSGSSSAIVHFETLDTKEKANGFTGCKLYIESNRLSTDEAVFSYDQLKGFSIIDQNNTLIGEITAIDDFGGNIVFTIGGKKNEILVSFNEDLLIEFKPESKQIIMECPTGLIELNLELRTDQKI
jgi:16S rRNA processing protein RimM